MTTLTAVYQDNKPTPTLVGVFLMRDDAIAFADSIRRDNAPELIKVVDLDLWKEWMGIRATMKNVVSLQKMGLTNLPE